MLLVPGLLAALIGAHLYLVAKLGTTAPPWTKAEGAADRVRAEAEASASRDESAREGGVPPRVRDPEVAKASRSSPTRWPRTPRWPCVVMAVIITMSLVLGAELGSKANPTTTTYVPRPEWYFFFLFELLRVIKPPSLVGWRRSACRRSA